MVFILYLGLAFFATFFNVCSVYTTRVRFEGGNATFMESIKFALGKIHGIFIWSLISATVGLLLRILDKVCEKAQESDNLVTSILGFIGSIIVSMFGVGWGLITAFVIPLMVYQDIGPIDAIKRSGAIFKKTWGESLIRDLGVGLIGSVITILGSAIFAGLGFLVAGMGKIAITTVTISGIIYITLCVTIFSLLGIIFNTALFVYADKGVMPQGYSKEIMATTFRVADKK